MTTATERYHIGDLVWRPLRMRGHVWMWSPAQVVATRRGEVVVQSYGWEYTHYPHDLRPRRLGRPTGYPIVPKSDRDRAWGR